MIMYSHRLRFGSQDSVDEDALYVFESLPSFSECQAFCGQGDDNRNIVTVVDGVIAQSFKGITDETNNALLATFDLHKQECENPVTQTVVRNVLLKNVRATRIILSLLSRTKYRPEVKAALRSNNQQHRQQVLQTIDFDSLEINPDSRKSIAFQLGQALALNQGHELYSKSMLKNHFSELTPYLNRSEVQSTRVLNDIRDRFLDSVSDIGIHCDGSLNLFFADGQSASTACNFQANGMIVELKPPERCITFPSTATELKNETESQTQSTISAFRYENEIRFASLQDFDCAAMAQAMPANQKLNLERLDFARYFYTFRIALDRQPEPSNDRLSLLGVRDRFTNRILDRDLGAG
ncbi:hypothetical protein N9Y42_03125 [Mariniblastus sp.]|nr:hypothetical protein [Mariniblastus sp.]